MTRLVAMTNDGKYTINEAGDGTLYCSCPAWKFQSRKGTNRSCKHIQGYLAGVPDPSVDFDSLIDKISNDLKGAM